MSNKMSDVFDLPVGDSEFTLVAMAKSTYMSMDKAAVIAINAYDANQDRIAELEKENRLLKQLEQIFNNSPDLTFDCCKRMLKDDFKAHNLEQQNKFIDILYKAGKCDADCLEYFKALKEQE
jgi:hypothetical protein